MQKILLVAVCAAAALRAEVRTLTLKEAVEAALKQNPEIALARLDEQKANEAVRVARDPFTPKLGVGSGLAYSYGFPMSIEGSAPSIFQAQGSQFLFNRPQSYAVKAAKEDARGATIGTESKREEVAYRVTNLYLDAERAARMGEVARRDAEGQERVLSSVQAQVREGRALPLAEKTAALHLAQVRQIAAGFEADQDAAEAALAIALGFPAADRVRPVAGERRAVVLPANQEQAMAQAIDNNKDLRRIESQIAAKKLEVKGNESAWMPRVDLVAQYGLFAKFNNYEDYFRRFQRHNGEIGVSFQLPILGGSGTGAQAAQGRADIARLNIQLANTKNQFVSDLQKAYRDVKTAQGATELARLDLEVAREQVAVNLAQMEEGRLQMAQVEASRLVENQKWMALYDAQYTVEKAQWAVLRLTGGLVAEVAR